MEDKINPAYLAGVIDSDGSISFCKVKRDSTKRGYQYRSIIQITWRPTPDARDFLHHVKDQFGGGVHMINKSGFEGGDALYLKYDVEGPRTEKFIKYILPYLKLKKEQAELLLEARKLKGKWGADGKPDKLWDKEDKLYDRYKKINTKNGA